MFRAWKPDTIAIPSAVTSVKIDHARCIPRAYFGMAALAIATLILSVNAPISWAESFVVRAGYGCSILAIIWFAACAWRPALHAARKHWRLLLLALPAWLIVHAFQPHVFKVEPDEYVIASTAQSIALRGHAMAVVEAWSPPGSAKPEVAGLVDKRPLAFPALVAVAHTMTGYRASNAIAINAALSFGVVVLTSVLGFAIAGIGGTAVGMLFWCGVPIAHYAFTSGGNDTFALCLLLATACTTWIFLREPNTPRFNLVAAALVVFCQARPESPLLALPFAIIVMIRALRDRIVPPRTFWIAPILLVPTILIRQVTGGADWNAELDVTGATQRFSLGHYPSNFAHAVEFLFSFSREHPNAPFLASLAIAAAPFALFQAWRDRTEHVVRALLGLIIAGLLFSMVSLGYFFGQWTDVVVARTTLPVFAALAAMLWLFQRYLKQRCARFSSRALPALCAGASFAIIPQLIPLRYESPTQSYVRALDRMLTDSASKSLWITSNPMQAVSANQHAMTFERANERAHEIRAALQSGHYARVWVVQWFRRRNAHWTPTEPPLTSTLSLAPSRTFAFRQEWQVKVSEVRLPSR